jgi:hypothetical protein
LTIPQGFEMAKILIEKGANVNDKNAQLYGDDSTTLLMKCE